MSELKLDTVLSDLKNRNNTLHANSITNFIEGLVMELLGSESVDIMENCPVNERHFLETGERAIYGNSLQINLTADSSMVVVFNAYCDFERNTVDETDNNSGKKGDIASVDKTYVELKWIRFYTHEGSFFDLTETESIRKYLYEQIKLEA